MHDSPGTNSGHLITKFSKSLDLEESSLLVWNASNRLEHRKKKYIYIFGWLEIHPLIIHVMIRNSGQNIHLGIMDYGMYKDIIIVSSSQMKNERLSVIFSLLCYKTKSNI